MCSDSEKNMSAFADQNHAPSLTCVRLELIYEFCIDKTGYEYYCINQVIQQYNNTEDA